jgi:GntR family transcriptional regulator
MEDPEGVDFLAELERSPLDRRSGVPLYLQVAGAIERQLRLTPLPLGRPLPAEHDLARTVGVSRPTIRQAIQRLANQGVLFSQRGVGTFAAPQTLTRPLRIGSLYEDLRDRGLSPATRVLTIAPARLDEATAGLLCLPRDTAAVQLERVRTADGHPVALIRNTVVLPPGGELGEAELTENGLYETLARRFGIEPAMGTQRLSAKLASPREAELLALEPPAALLRAERLAFDANGRGIERSTTLYIDSTEIEAPTVNHRR